MSNFELLDRLLIIKNGPENPAPISPVPGRIKEFLNQSRFEDLPHEDYQASRINRTVNLLRQNPELPEKPIDDYLDNLKNFQVEQLDRELINCLVEIWEKVFAYISKSGSKEQFFRRPSDPTISKNFTEQIYQVWYQEMKVWRREPQTKLGTVPWFLLGQKNVPEKYRRLIEGLDCRFRRLKTVRPLMYPNQRRDFKENSIIFYSYEYQERDEIEQIQEFVLNTAYLYYHFPKLFPESKRPLAGDFPYYLHKEYYLSSPIPGKAQPIFKNSEPWALMEQNQVHIARLFPEPGNESSLRHLTLKIPASDYQKLSYPKIAAQILTSKETFLDSLTKILEIFDQQIMVIMEPSLEIARVSREQRYCYTINETPIIVNDPEGLYQRICQVDLPDPESYFTSPITASLSDLLFLMVQKVGADIIKTWIGRTDIDYYLYNFRTFSGEKFRYRTSADYVKNLCLPRICTECGVYLDDPDSITTKLAPGIYSVSYGYDSDFDYESIIFLSGSSVPTISCDSCVFEQIRNGTAYG